MRRSACCQGSCYACFYCCWLTLTLTPLLLLLADGIAVSSDRIACRTLLVTVKPVHWCGFSQRAQFHSILDWLECERVCVCVSHACSPFILADYRFNAFHVCVVVDIRVCVCHSHQLRLSLRLSRISTLCKFSTSTNIYLYIYVCTVMGLCAHYSSSCSPLSPIYLNGHCPLFACVYVFAQIFGIFFSVFGVFHYERVCVGKCGKILLPPSFC